MAPNGNSFTPACLVLCDAADLILGVQLVNGYSSETAIANVPPLPLDQEHKQPAAVSLEQEPRDGDDSAELQDDNDSDGHPADND